MGNYTSMEVTGTAHRSTKFDELNVNKFKVKGPSSGSLGRCFVEVKLRNNRTNIVLEDVSINTKLLCPTHRWRTDSEATVSL